MKRFWKFCIFQKDYTTSFLVWFPRELKLMQDSCELEFIHYIWSIRIGIGKLEIPNKIFNLFARDIVYRRKMFKTDGPHQEKLYSRLVKKVFILLPEWNLKNDNYILNSLLCVRKPMCFKTYCTKKIVLYLNKK